MELKTLFTILHLFGVALGAGGAYLSDLIFMHSISDRKISKTEIGFMELGSRLVWGGLILLVVSGIGLFATDPAGYLASTKFQVKMTIVLILTINGLVFKFIHMPRIKRHLGHHYPSSDEFRRGVVSMLLSGVISIISWTAAIILGSLRSIEYTFFQALMVYFVIIVLSLVGALSLKNKIFFEEKK